MAGKDKLQMFCGQDCDPWCTNCAEQCTGCRTSVEDEIVCENGMSIAASSSNFTWDFCTDNGSKRESCAHDHPVIV